MPNDLISVIVPIYKVEKYINRCIDSIISQTYKNLEVILVDDGSPDMCPQICDSYTQKDSRIKVLHKRNGGLSSARNAGTNLAKGKYITFIDSDDWVNKDFIHCLYKLIIQFKAQMSIVAMEKVYADEKSKKNNCVSLAEHIFVLNRIEAMEAMLYQKKFDTSAWGKLYSIQMVKKNLFPEGRLHEDDYTTYKFIDSSTFIGYCDIPMYYYYQRPESIMTNKSLDNLDELYAVDELYDFIYAKYPSLLPAALSRKYSNYFQMYLATSPKENPEIYRDIEYFLKNHRLEMLCNSKARIKNRIAALLLYLGRNTTKAAAQLEKRLENVR